MSTKPYDLIVIGSGASGMMAAIIAARQNRNVLLIEKLKNLGAKLKATGGGRCNLTNTLPNDQFMQQFGRHGRFMQDAIHAFDHHDLIRFFKDIGVETHAPDGFRIFPTSHSAVTIINALKNELEKLHVTIKTDQKVTTLLYKNDSIAGVKTITDTYYAPNVILATGGLGYPLLGAEGDGYSMVQKLGHKVTSLHPAMMPLTTKEKWVECRADTMPKVEIRVALPKYKKLKAYGDLIFTKNGIRGPVVLDFAREITPLLDKYDEIPIILNLTKGMDEDKIIKYFKNQNSSNNDFKLYEMIATLLPVPLSKELCKLSGLEPDDPWKELKGKTKEMLIKNLAWTPMTVIGHDGFKMAMITRGGVTLKEINPKTMESRIIKGLYFCGEVMDLDGPCGGYNLQWSFSSGFLSGQLHSF